MDTVHDGCSDKRRILSELSKSLKTVFVEASTSRDNYVQLKTNCSLINCIDRSLQHGLVNLMNSYWPLVRGCSHTQTLETIETWLGPQSSNRIKGQAWLVATLLEGSLLSYLQCILAEHHTIVHYYAPHAIMRDPSCITQFSSLLTGLESINFKLERSTGFNHESCSLAFEEDAPVTIKSILELPLNSTHGGTGTVMTNSMTSSLASPVDSGFTQLDSETDTASFSEVLLDADSASMKEDIAVLPVDPCIEKTLNAYGTSEAMLVKNKSMAPALVGKASESCDDEDAIVYQRKKNILCTSSAEKHQKRVSFHDGTSDSLSDAKNLDAVSVNRETDRLSNSFKTSASNISRAVGDLSSFESEEEGVEIAGDLSLLGNEGIEELCARSMVSEIRSEVFPLSSENILIKTPVTERGTPEGQEDPPIRWSISTAISDHPSLSVCDRQQMSKNLSSALSVSNMQPKVSTPKKFASSSSTSGLSCAYGSSVLTQTPSKACLVKKFLRSITEKKISNHRSATVLAALKQRTLSVRKLNLYINGVNPTEELSEEVLNELREEMKNSALNPSHNHPYSDNLTQSVKHILGNHLELSSTENICKVLKTRSIMQDANGRREELLTVITNQATYILSNRLSKQSVLFHADLSSVLVGPNSQWVSLMSKDKEYKVNLLVGELDMVSELVGCIERCLRQKFQKQMDLPTIVQLSYEEYFRISQWRTIVQCEKVYHYSVVHALEEFSSSVSTSPEPIMKSYFMYRVSESTNSVWEPGYFVLKAGVLYVSSDEEETSSLFSLNLEEVDCRSVSLVSRPHTIEVGNIQIAAPDDFVAHEWLMAFQEPCTKLNENLNFDHHKLNIINGSLILTESRIILISSLGIPHADLHMLGKPFLTALISDVTSFQSGDDNSPWCFMEFSCREVHDSGEDYVLFFHTYHEMIAFRNSLSLLRPSLMQECKVLSKNVSLYRRCNQVADTLSADWDFVNSIL